MAKPEGNKHLGIYISPREICIAQVKIGANSRPESEHLVKFETGFPLKEGILRPLSLNHEFFSETAAWIPTLKQALKKVNWDTSSAVVTLSPQFAILRYFVMPVIDRKFWSRSIPLESKKFIPVSFEEVVYDFNVISSAGAKKLGVLFGLTQRKSVEFIAETFKAAGITLAAIEINSASMERLFGFVDQQAHDAKGYIHFSGNTTLMLFSHGGYPVLYRETEAYSGDTMGERRRLDIKGAMQFVDRYVGGKEYKTIVLSGDGADDWKASAERESAPVAVEVWDCAKACSLNSNDAAGLFAAGAALRGRVAGKLKLDISGISIAIGVEKQVQEYVLNTTFILGGFLLLFSLISQVRLMLINSNLSALSSTVENVPELQGGDAEGIRLKIENAQTSARILMTLVTDTDTLVPKLSAIAEKIPADLWLGEIQYSNPFSISEVQSGAREMRLIGETFLKGEVKIRLVDTFSKSLKATEEFKVFTPPLGGIDSTTGESASVSGGTVSDSRTSGFSIMCLSKKR